MDHFITGFTSGKYIMTVLSAEMNKEYVRWKNYLLNLLTLTFDNKGIA